MALIQSMDEQLAAWDAASATGLFSLHAFVSLDGKHMLPCARVEWRIAPLPGTNGMWRTGENTHIWTCWRDYEPASGEASSLLHEACVGAAGAMGVGSATARLQQCHAG